MPEDESVQRTKEKLEQLISQFNASVQRDLRTKVLEIIPMWEQLLKLGCELIPKETASSARNRILHYFLSYPKTIISYKEIQVVSGISEWARRVRELCVEFGWSIVSGSTAKEMHAEGEFENLDHMPDIEEMKAADYILFKITQDREAAHRWHVAKDIRNSHGGSKSKILAFLRKNVGCIVTGDELRYVAKDASEWARRVRELRTEGGWPIATYWSGRPDLTVGEYILEDDRQAKVHDRKIDDKTRKFVLERDKLTCQSCSWSRKDWIPELPRHLEIHHILPHAYGGKSVPKNLITYCNSCHDDIHNKTLVIK